ncbi:hypothetical protein GLAREA_04209 [Glarea lozoyensis ATCC 20868]|uniref:Uncharacterized protein n=1 Tax=Glarea lozoyensis (strain ATCC 20868 / MF5171) TaxID=1116229 RepID=S3DLJ4_GLAL2|nr:uncharacterized protein GLAREA_04209 [Glarea lozoyensis ATCC 20868]EPE27418.1 hypothetical protein GLAREA_04209 [Glarea lozoyensis ATCC 20868]
MALLHPRYIPPSTAINAAKLTTKTILILTFLVLLSVILGVLTCYCCCQRRIWRFRARRIARNTQPEPENPLKPKAKRDWRFWVKSERKSRGLGPRIHGRNARFYAPGLGRERLVVHEEEMRRIRAMERERVDVEEVRRPGKVFERWKWERGV